MLTYADGCSCDIVPLICDDVTPRRDLLSGQVGLITSNLIYIDFSKAASTSSAAPCSAAPTTAAAASPPLGVAGVAGADNDVVFESKIRELIRALGDRGKVP
jgi:hypothetical protein